MSTRGRPLSIAAFVGRAAAVLEEATKHREPDRYAITFQHEGEGQEEAREIAPHEIRARQPEPGRYVFVERLKLPDGTSGEVELYECRVSKTQLMAAQDREPSGGGSLVGELRAALDSALVAQRGVTDQWRGVAEAESRRAHGSHDLLMQTLREREARETELRDELAKARERATVAEAAAAGWRPEHVTALLPLVDRALGLYQGHADDRALVRLLDSLPVDLRDSVLDAIETRERAAKGTKP